MSESTCFGRITAWIALGLILPLAGVLAEDWPGAPERVQIRFGSVEDVPPRGAPVVLASDVEAATTRQPPNGQSESNRGFDPSVVASGRGAFERSCTSCHDAQRSLGKSKNYAGWLGTVQRMASKDGADIPASDMVPIATYLASLSGSSAAAGAGSTENGGGWTFGTTVSTLHRSASDEAPLENPGFFADVWVTASYQSSGPWRATVTACTSCHSTNTAISAYSLELVEGSATLDLRELMCKRRCDDGREFLLKAGRFVVPFAAFSAMSHPGIYHTVTTPLMFNMGRRVFVPGSSPPQQPVLPLPFADEGLDFIFRTSVAENLSFTLDMYAVNGLQGTTPNIFNQSRAYSDNNEDPSTGGRITLGGDCFRVGTSVMYGNLQDQGLPIVDYTLFGADATAQVTDNLRLYFEYAMRERDSVIVPGTVENTHGIVAESELKLLEQPNISLLVRYDTLEHRNQAFGNASLERWTWGLNVGLPGGSLLMINHEHWVPGIGEDVDVLGVRWTVSL